MTHSELMSFPLPGRFRVWDYTLPLLREPGRFASEDMVPGAVARLPRPALTALLPVVSTYVWVATPSDRRPAGDPLREPPVRLASPL